MDSFLQISTSGLTKKIGGKFSYLLLHSFYWDILF